MKENKLKEFLRSSTGKVVLIVVLYALFLGILTAVIGIVGSTGGIIIGLVCAYFGWRFLNKITPDVFLIMPVAGWLLFFIIKGMLAIFVGVFVTPYVISKSITDAIQDGCNNQ